MKRLGRIILLTSCLGVTAVALSFFPRRPVAAAPDPPAIPVNVENTPTVSAKQSGTWNVGVTGTPNVNATQSGTWNVGLTGTPTVNANVTFPSSIGVTGGPVSVSNPLNSSSQPVPLMTREDKDLVDEPFATSICAGSSGGLGPSSSCAAVASSVGLPSTPPASFTVPSVDSAGNTVKGLVIKFVSGNCYGGASPLALVTAVSPNAIDGVMQATNFLNTSPSGIVSQSANIVAGPGTSVGMSGANSGPCFLTANGYLAH